MSLATAFFAAACALKPPPWPQSWVRGGPQVNALPLPPWQTLMPPAPFTFSRMEAFYDWEYRALRETYHDFCVPIFPGGFQWSCDFVNVNNISYLLQHADRPKLHPECCIFRKPWSPPSPDFVPHSGILSYLKNSTYGGETIAWWQTTSVSRDEGGPFGYGYSIGADGGLTPRAFYFGGLWPYSNGTLGGAFTMQYFEGFRAAKPPASTWDLPASCARATACPDFAAVAQERRAHADRLYEEVARRVARKAA